MSVKLIVTGKSKNMFIAKSTNTYEPYRFVARNAKEQKLVDALSVGSSLTLSF